MNTICIVGTGPTALYALQELVASPQPLDIALYEKSGSAGTGMPYRAGVNDAALLANIASIEIPPLVETLEDWLASRSDTGLDGLGVARDDIDERAFFPRIVLGAYFRDQLFRLIDRAQTLGHAVKVMTHHEITDIVPSERSATVHGVNAEGEAFVLAFDHVVVATGHANLSHADGEERPTYFTSPYPTCQFEGLPPARVGIRGTSLSAIDTAVAIAGEHGEFEERDGKLIFRRGRAADGLSLTMMSRSGVVPEADSYCPIPHEPIGIFNEAAVGNLIEAGSAGLLDRVMALFLEQLGALDGGYLKQLGNVDADTFAKAYFAPRAACDPMDWARRNLEEVERNRLNAHTVSWRYAILRMHEAFETAIGALARDDQERFSRGMKRVFIDNYAAIPPASIERLLALHDAGVLEILRLGSDYELPAPDKGAPHILQWEGGTRTFDVVVDATGEAPLQPHDIPFDSLRSFIVSRAPKDPGGGVVSALDEHLRVTSRDGRALPIYIVALPFLLPGRPFVQGLMVCSELGDKVAKDILRRVRQSWQEISLGDIVEDLAGADDLVSRESNSVGSLAGTVGAAGRPGSAAPSKPRSVPMVRRVISVPEPSSSGGLPASARLPPSRSARPPRAPG